MALPFGLPLGLELYSVREELPKDYAGTLKKVAALGYRDVEAAGFYGHSAAEAKAAMADAGLHCVSAHHSMDDLSTKLDEIIAFHKVLGAQYIVCSYPGHKNPPANGRGAHVHARGLALERGAVQRVWRQGEGRRASASAITTTRRSSWRWMA